MNASENLSDLREEMRKAEREASLREAKARILAETIGVQREELERVISIAHATQSRTLGYDIKADEIAESSLKIEQGKLQLEQANTQAEEAREHLRKVRSKVQEVGKKEDSKRRVQEAWEELAVLVQRFEGTESFAGSFDVNACDGSPVTEARVRNMTNRSGITFDNQEATEKG